MGAHHIYVSTDGMMTWQQQSTQDLTGGCANGGCALTDLEFAPSNHTKAYAVAKQSGATPFKVFNTNQADTDSGATWLDVTANLGFDTSKTQATGIAISPFDPNVAYLSLSGLPPQPGLDTFSRPAISAPTGREPMRVLQTFPFCGFWWLRAIRRAKRF